MSGSGLNKQFAESLIETLHSCNCRYWLLLRFQVITTRVLRLFLPEKLSRQIPMLFYLIGRSYAEHRKIKHLESFGLTKNNSYKDEKSKYNNCNLQFRKGHI